MKDPNNHNLFSIRQAAQLIGCSYRTMNNYLDQRKIDYIQIDHFRVVSHDEVDGVITDGVIHESKAQLDGYKTVTQAARILNINTASLKRYVKEERIDNVKEHNIFFIPDETIDIWLKVPKPRTPNTVEAYYLKAVTVREAARLLGVCSSRVRVLIKIDQLDAVDGLCWYYVTKASVHKYTEVQKMINSL